MYNKENKKRGGDVSWTREQQTIEVVHGWDPRLRTSNIMATLKADRVSSEKAQHHHHMTKRNTATPEYWNAGVVPSHDLVR